MFYNSYLSINVRLLYEKFKGLQFEKIVSCDIVEVHWFWRALLRKVVFRVGKKNGDTNSSDTEIDDEVNTVNGCSNDLPVPDGGEYVVIVVVQRIHALILLGYSNQTAKALHVHLKQALK